jgi:hypothetical protein
MKQCLKLFNGFSFLLCVIDGILLTRDYHPVIVAFSLGVFFVLAFTGIIESQRTKGKLREQINLLELYEQNVKNNVTGIYSDALKQSSGRSN